MGLAQARSSALGAGAERVHYSAMDAERLAFPDDCFDLICGSSILHHLDLASAYRELCRTLKPHGAAVFYEPLGHNPAINLYRRATPALRTADEHPLLWSDLEGAQRYFAAIETQFFHLFSLLAVPFRRFRWFPTWVRWLDAADRRLFDAWPATRRFAWRAVIVLSSPRKGTAGPTDSRAP